MTYAADDSILRWSENEREADDVPHKRAVTPAKHLDCGENGRDNAWNRPAPGHQRSTKDTSNQAVSAPSIQLSPLELSPSRGSSIPPAYAGVALDTGDNARCRVGLVVTPLAVRITPAAARRRRAAPGGGA